MKKTGSAALILRLSVFPAVLALLMTPRAFAASSSDITSRVDRTEVGDEDTFQLTISVQGEEPDDLRLPKSPDFETLSQSSSTQMSFSMGGPNPGMRRTTRYTLLMRANRTGKLTIPSAEMKIGKKVYKTDPITMTVKSGRLGSSPRQAQRPSLFPGFPGFPEDDDEPDLGMPDMGRVPRNESDLFLQAVLDKKEAYVGEQVTFSLYLMSRVDITSVEQLLIPKMDGFWSEELDSPRQLVGEQRTVDGVPYRAFLLKRRALFPMKAGKIEIGQVEAEVLSGFMFSAHRLKRKSEPVALDVKALPSGAPPGFSPNNVGQWQVSLELADPKVTLGNPATARLTLEGTGNLRNVSPPKLQAPPQLKVYDPTPSEQINTRDSQVHGRRTFEYLVMPAQTGTFTFPELSFDYFNPNTGAYEKATTQPISLTVEPGGLVTAAPGGPARNVLPGDVLRPLRYQMTADNSVHSPVWRRPVFWVATALPFTAWFALGLLGWMRRRWTTETEATVLQRGVHSARSRLAQAEKVKAEGPADVFYGEVEKAVLGYFEAKLRMPLGGLRREGLVQALRAAGLGDERLKRVVRVLEACEMGRFAPGGGDAVRDRVLEDAAFAMEEPR